MTTGEVARRLGVAPTTVRSWDQRYGLGPAARVGGRHRRWTAGDLARLERMCALTATGLPPAEAARLALHEAGAEAAAADAPPEGGPAGGGSTEGGPVGRGSTGRGSTGRGSTGRGPAGSGPRGGREPLPGAREPLPGGGGPGGGAPGAEAPAPRRAVRARRPADGGGLRLGDARQECKGLARAALRLDAAALDAQLEAAIEEYGLVAAWQEVIMPTLQAVGRKWENSGERYVEVEHFLSWHVSGALRRHTPPVPTAPAAAPDRSGAATVLACVPGENHTLPLEVLAAALAERGLPVRMFGAAVPVESLVAAVRRTGPAAVGLWAQSRTTASRPLAQYVAGLEWGVRGARRRPAVLTLGPGWAGQTVPGLPHPPGLAEAVAAVESAVRG
ncbi:MULTISPECIES: MerR family transcriptional regulator [Streptomyces]|uniref:HTH-type transcriptional repressor YcgE n=3 Tax=Streptomyces fradiae TaxID=1906 RepID=A0A1Y2NR62_STRFR|nr:MULTISPECIES: cobalamin B12-binding domain-containing protein [Streptomyces]OSY49983.1 HTH-type transcriptional repressor YcgE [Streptomyces fradiae ATCC 10745 = DSM 40063]